jgi:hypothetical protein
MSGKRNEKSVRGTVLIILLLCMALTMGDKPKAMLDVAMGPEHGRALLQLGAASISIAFDFGQKCSNPNACVGAIL